MELAINFSQKAADLLTSGSIRLDRFKTPDWPDLIERAGAYLPVYVHFAINAGADDSRTLDWKLADELAHQTQTPFINLHIAPRAKDFPGENPRPLVDRLLADVERATAFFGRERVIVENIPLGNPDENFAVAGVLPEVLNEVVDRTGCGFLLDLSHARLTARHLKLKSREYISALPVKKIRELHITGLQMVEGKLRDHMPMHEEDWQDAEWAMTNIRAGLWGTPTNVAFEYGGVGAAFEWRCDRDIIAEQAPRLYEMVHR